MMHRLIAGVSCLLLFTVSPAKGYSYEVTLHGGPRMDIPEAWILDDSDPSVPSWFSPDRRAGVEVVLWAPDTWPDLAEFVESIRPEGAEGDVVSFPHWSGEAALADWVFPSTAGPIRGWFLITSGIGPDVKIAAIASEEDFDDFQPQLLSVLDSYTPGVDWRKTPGAVGQFLEISDDSPDRRVALPFEDRRLEWTAQTAGNTASQDIIEREALVLAGYSRTPDLFYEAWKRYYRLIFRDSYRRFEPIIDALKSGPLPPGRYSDREVTERLLDWLQGFSYGSTEGFSDLLAPATACATETGDCDSLALALLIILDSYGIDGRILITHQAAHAVAAVDVSGEGLRYVEGNQSWLVAELTTKLPLGVLPERLDGVNDWFAIDVFVD